MSRDHVVEVISIEWDGEEISTGLFGPMTETECDGWCRIYENMAKAHDKEHGTESKYRLVIRDLSNPFTFGDTEDLRQKLYGFAN